MADDFNGRQGWNALLLTKRAFPIFAVSGSDDGQLDAAFNDARADGAAGESGGVVNVQLLMTFSRCFSTVLMLMLNAVTAG